jgi:hypothetical protein
MLIIIALLTKRPESAILGRVAKLGRADYRHGLRSGSGLEARTASRSRPAFPSHSRVWRHGLVGHLA